jgi:hypothetical protein
MVSKQRSDRKGNPPVHRAAPLPDGGPVSRARSKVKRLWQPGDLFHCATRYPRKPKAPKIDRLAGILRRGLLAPATCADGLVRSDLNIVCTGMAVPYDSLVFLHRYKEASFIYTVCDPGRFAVFVNPALAVLTEDDMGPNWCVLCQDEVYVRDRVDVESLTGIAVHPADAKSVLGAFLADFQRLAMPLYDYDGTVLWPAG